ncbi:PTS sugar transporter subunit IIA [Pseudoduganella sp. GCM10020061]|uniref:PTS sugar transporter subunit IIA n=1 Tax=Pseudoduganella sp. GCM10020061 TaxID=3317345 RepID=UPI0036413BF4
MVGILLLTHAPLGQAFMSAVEHVFRGPTEHFEAIDVQPDQDLAEVNKLATAAIRRVDDGDGVLVITDIKGGTPANCCDMLANAGHVEVIAGISLPMLLRAITYRRDSLDVVVEMALAGGQNGVVRCDNRVRVG